MNRSIWIVFRKEFTDLLRDRKTWVGAFAIPIILIPLVFFLLGSAISGVEQDARTYIPIVIKGELNQPLAQNILSTPGVKLLNSSNPAQSLQTSKIRLIIELPNGLEKQLSLGQHVTIPIWYDPSNQKSTIARETIEKVIQDYEQKVVAKRLEAVGLSTQSIHPIELHVTSVASKERMSGSMLATIIPLMLMLSLASGGIPAATDLIAGEKERGTLEALISSPVSGSSVLIAKLLTTMIMGMVSATASLISLSIIYTVAPIGTEEAGVSLGFFNPLSVLVLLLMILLLAAMFAGVELAVSASAKTFKEAQTYLAPIAILAVVPSYMLMPLNPADIPLYYHFLPLFNGAAVFKEIFYGDLQWLHVLGAIGSSLCYVGIAIWLAAYFFRQERLLIR
ncbi:ABC transporter permease [Brevibacillus ginsengisoli]|uniref:ABC transporter permease n=1 Tax=Brevibacillus ginsengisoli TaxID=363854 RepID=UPI003CF5047F